MPEHGRLREFIAEHDPLVSVVSYVEVLGYHLLTERERRGFEEFFAAAEMLDPTQPVLSNAVRLRQVRKMTLGDSLVAGTALAHDLTLVTRNSRDFGWIPNLSLLNPFEER